MSETLSGTFGQPALEPPDPMQRVERLDRDSPDRERRQQEDFGKEKRRSHPVPQEEDQVKISDAALRALRDSLPEGPPPAP